MGLAASQARFLGLTARKSNVEYQGQQINQARTALSNEVMNLYEKYNNLDVPTPPSINDYVKTTYTLDSTYEKYQIASFSKITSGDDAGYYNVMLKYTDPVAKAYTYTAKAADITAEKNGNTFSKITLTIGTDTFEYDANNTEGSSIIKIPKDEHDSYDNYTGLRTIMAAHPEYGPNPVFYGFTRDSQAYYTTEDTLINTAFNQQGEYYGQYTFDYQGVQNTDKTIPAIAALTQESSGRLSAITIKSCDDDPDLKGNSYSITTGEEDDQRAYDDAMNKYYYDKAKYEREVEIINRKTEKIQTQDKALELKLNQLDTEQKAISTEIDSITKVIEDTIESVFKTYNN